MRGRGIYLHGWVPSFCMSFCWLRQDCFFERSRRELMWNQGVRLASSWQKPITIKLSIFLIPLRPASPPQRNHRKMNQPLRRSPSRAPTCPRSPGYFQRCQPELRPTLRIRGVLPMRPLCFPGDQAWVRWVARRLKSSGSRGQAQSSSMFLTAPPVWKDTAVAPCLRPNGN